MTRDVQMAYEECRRITRGAGSSFYAGMQVLPAERRQAIFAVYALARRIDDIADGALPPDTKLTRLGEVRAALRSSGESRDPVVVAVADAASRYPIPLDAFDDLVDGAEADARGRRYETFADLEWYCRCVAGSIGRLALGVFLTDERQRAERFADDLGVALQLGNILRDLGEDLRQGRAYLPATDLERFGCRIAGDRLAGDAELLVAFEAQRGLGWLERGLQLVPLVDRRSGCSVMGMAGPYRRLLERIATNPGLALRGRVSLPRWEKRWAFMRGVAEVAARGAAA
ncbi:squalene/phytoene synthase family protein [Gaiella sp.]|jgi:phytoene synthase|uniref:squalene/phytoene synthase family protein n=1 Tax=Gaiella sp. TaxID=2663207 RepID=UPI002E33F089|nr:squalene/phytoene synthase family protein [Gaiella sp.]HEX5583439.1 squalene/phytoene synthase family protein [Gaiella sp.]